MKIILKIIRIISQFIAHYLILPLWGKLRGDLVKAKKREWMELFCIVMVILLFVASSNTKADYEYKFGDQLKQELSLDNRWNIVNLDKLARAVAKHETADCTKGSARFNNCFGIMHWPNGKRTLRQYPTKQASYDHFKAIWSKYYGGRLPTIADAKRYSGNDKALAWYRNVHYFYDKL